MKVPSAAAAIGGGMLWRMRTKTTKKFCAWMHIQSIFLQTFYRTVPGGLVTPGTFELTQVKFLLPSSGVCNFTACKTIRSPWE